MHVKLFLKALDVLLQSHYTFFKLLELGLLRVCVALKVLLRLKGCIIAFSHVLYYAYIAYKSC